MPYAIVAGAGPVGALSAIFLAQQGFTVEVLSLLSSDRDAIVELRPYTAYTNKPASRMCQKAVLAF